MGRRSAGGSRRFVDRDVPGAAKIGAQLFVGKAGCSDCHNTPLFSDGLFHNVGVGQIGPGVPKVEDCPADGVCDCAPESDDHMSGPKNCLPSGAPDGLQKLQANGFRRNSMWSDDKSYIAPAPPLRPIGGYRTPSLRNVALTAPYMHDGSIATLADVVWHYNQGISDENTPGAPTASFRPLYLSTDEQAALVAFLEIAGLGAPAGRRYRAADAPLEPGTRRKQRRNRTPVEFGGTLGCGLEAAQPGTGQSTARRRGDRLRQG